MPLSCISLSSSLVRSAFLRIKRVVIAADAEGPCRALKGDLQCRHGFQAENSHIYGFPEHNPSDSLTVASTSDRSFPSQGNPILPH